MAKQKSKRPSSRSTKSTSGRGPKATGLGDTVEKVFEATGVAKVAKWALGEDCGCDDRREVLNKIFPYRKPECLTEDEYNYLDGFFTGKTNRVEVEVQLRLIEIYNRVFKDNAEPTSCSSCFLNNILKKLERVYKEYQ